MKHLIFSLLLAAGIILRLFHLDYSDFWYDEMISLHFAKDPSWLSVFWDNTPLLYNVILKIWVGWWGDSEAMTRLLSVFFSLGTLGLFYYLGSLRLAVIYLLSSFSLYYAREVRVYALFEFFATLNLLLFVNTKSSRGFYLSILPLLFSHYFSLLQLFLLGVWQFWQEKKKNLLFWFLGGMIILSVIFFRQVRWDSISWMWLRMKLNSWTWFPHEVVFELLGSNWILVLAFIGLWAADVFKWKELNNKNKFLIFYIFSVFVIASVGSLISGASLMVPRYYIFLIPAMALYLDEKIILLEGKKYKTAILVLLFLISTYSIRQVYLKEKSPWSAAADLVSSTLQPVVFTTRSVGISTPYFTRKGLSIKKWPLDKNGVMLLEQALQSGQQPWLVETYLGSLQYFDSLEVALKEKGYLVERHALATKGSEPIVLLKIIKN